MKKITNFEVGTLTYFIIRSYFIFLSFSSLINTSYQNSYISIILSIIIGIIPLLIIYLIFNYEPSSNIFDKMKKLFGKNLGNIINFILILFTYFLTITSFINLISMIYTTYLDKTPDIIISIAFALCILYCLKKGINTTLRNCIILFIISIIITIFSQIGLIFKIDLNNFKPVSYNHILNSSFNFLSYNIMPLYLLLLIPKNKIVNNNKTKKITFIFYLIASISLLLTLLSIIGTFGIKLSVLYDYPEFEVLKYVYVTGISSRLESILFISWILDIIIFIIYSIHFCTIGITSIKPIKKNIAYTIFTISLILFNTKLINIFIINNTISKHLSLFIFIIPTLILLLCIIQLFKKKEISTRS